MSLADLYREDQTQSEDEDEFVPSEASSSESEHEDEEGSNTPPPTEEQRQQSKRRIDEIWQEMNQPTAKTPRTESQACSSLPTSPSPSTKQPPPPAAAAEPQPTSPSAIPAKEPKPQTAATGRPRRRPSKFSKMAEMVEQRRAKKANTLDTARKSWSGFVAAEGIREDLDKANKDGYVERKEFLDRVDHRTYEKARGMKKK
ncbi:swr complex subunit [Coemansia sp. RSA 1821]|nr:bucentaur or craniofacial development-domain-containing protein [Coemansia mojavensis]KAJ1743804.1 swr complex subunit [Coemansia sp. RSA 1086]KAJ1751805.1 swr complex subunit [Coemansia sp. RSA 1821]KAJ2652520.1 swr complex subunit [Coemansia sp. RSA 1250]